jgi:hypothetical protein
MIAEIAIATAAVAAAGTGGILLRRRAAKRAAETEAAVEAILPPPTATPEAPTAALVKIANGGRAVLAYWLAHEPWEGKTAALKRELHARLDLGDFHMDLSPKHGAAQAIHLPFEYVPPPSLTGNATVDALAKRRHALAESMRMGLWLADAKEVELPLAVVEMARPALAALKVPANIGPYLADLIKALDGA